MSSETHERSIIAEIIDNVLLVHLEGPVTPALVARAHDLARPLVEKLAASDTWWGSVISVEKDASLFLEALELWHDLTQHNPKLYVKRVCTAWVVDKKVPHSYYTGLMLKESYASRLQRDILTFDSLTSAHTWLKKRLDSSNLLK